MLYQLEVKNFVINDDFDKEVYMSMSLGYGYQKIRKYCKLEKFLYGLKQSCRIGPGGEGIEVRR